MWRNPAAETLDQVAQLNIKVLYNLEPTTWITGLDILTEAPVRLLWPLNLALGDQQVVA